jgi:hypothetical protein
MMVGYGCGSAATGLISLSGHIKSDDPEKEGHPGLPYWGLCVRQYHPVKKVLSIKAQKLPRVGRINRKRCDYRKREFIFRTWEA